MGNCLFKRKGSYCERLEAEIYYLQKENLRAYVSILREIKTAKSSVTNLKFTNSSTVVEPQIVTYV